MKRFILEKVFSCVLLLLLFVAVFNAQVSKNDNKIDWHIYLTLFNSVKNTLRLEALKAFACLMCKLPPYYY